MPFGAPGAPRRVPGEGPGGSRTPLLVLLVPFFDDSGVIIDDFPMVSEDILGPLFPSLACTGNRQDRPKLHIL